MFKSEEIEIKERGYLDIEIDPTLDLFEEIKKLKKEKNAIILAHYYQDVDIQDIADYIGDSLGLAREAEKTDASIIVFAGVHFMAETAKILNPSDVICTSSNAQKIVESFPKEQPLIFAPDKNLGAYINKKTNRSMVLWNGACMVHEIFSLEKIIKLKSRFPDAKLIAHPECEEAILRIADMIGSTTELLKFTQTDSSDSYIVATESGILHQMIKSSPQKTFIPAPPNNNCACNDCPHMKRNTLEKIYTCLLKEQPELIMDEATRKAAQKPIERMLEISKLSGV